MTRKRAFEYLETAWVVIEGVGMTIVVWTLPLLFAYLAAGRT